jgi:RNA polymerase sigma-70 factor, ECF subfamily
VALAEVYRLSARLSIAHQEVQYMVVIEGLPYEDAAAALEVPIGTIRSRLSRARLELKCRMEGVLVTPSRPFKNT